MQNAFMQLNFDMKDVNELFANKLSSMVSLVLQLLKHDHTSSSVSVYLGELNKVIKSHTIKIHHFRSNLNEGERFCMLTFAF